MTYHFGNNEYYNLVGKSLVDSSGVIRIIQKICEEHDSLYNMTDGYAGNAYRIYLMVAGNDEMESLHFRNFIEVIEKYGELENVKPSASLTIKPKPKKNIQKWAKIYPQ